MLPEKIAVVFTVVPHDFTASNQPKPQCYMTVAFFFSLVSMWFSSVVVA